MDTSTFMREKDIDIFRACAKRFNVAIGVRRTNPESLKYIDRAGYAAKRLDCKAKTADNHVTLNGRTYETAGLVVNPHVVGAGAYRGGKLESALKEWNENFAGMVAEDVAGKTYFPGGKLYGVQTNPAHKHFGCVMFASSSLITAALYVHGDYDLYAIVPMDAPDATTFVVDKHWGSIDMKHARAKELYDVQIFLNSRFGRPLVLHGDQEKYRGHTDEDVDFFLCDGSVRVIRGKAELEALYRETFKGRGTGGAGAVTQPAGGLWQQVSRPTPR